MSTLGIAITTFNHSKMVIDQVKAIRRLTNCAFDLVVCDDGSTDDTMAALTELGEIVVCGDNRGVAWNKNRGLFYLLTETNSSAILLLDDDVMPDRVGWQESWVEAVERFGHVNFLWQKFKPERLVFGEPMALSPGLAIHHDGPVIGCSREACAKVGFFDLRFGRWGHEHVDFTDRFLRSGFGGSLPSGNVLNRKLYYVLSCGIDLLPRVSTVSAEDKSILNEQNKLICLQSSREQVYREPWHTDDERRVLLQEIILAKERMIIQQARCAEVTQRGGRAERGSGVHATRCRSNRQLFFLHVPKTAGTSINALFSELYGDERTFCHLKSTSDAAATLKALPEEIRYVAGDLRLPLVLSGMEREKWWLFALLRNPVDHLISHLKGVKSLARPERLGELKRHPEAVQEIAHRLWTTSLNDIDSVGRMIREEFVEARQYFDNCQTRYFIERCDDFIGVADATAAVRALSTLDYVGLTEQMADACAALSTLSGEAVRPEMVRTLNTGPLDEFVDLADPAVRDFYREAVRWDALLYTSARNAAHIVPGTSETEIAMA